MNKPKPADYPVLLWDGTQWVRAIWAPQFTLEASLENDDVEIDESGNYYAREGWYEIQSHGSDEAYWKVPCQDDSPWCFLPENPTNNGGK